MDHTISYEVSLATLPTVLQAVPRTTLDTIAGNLLGDGSIGYSNLSRDGVARGNARYGMTMAAKVYDYLLNLYNTTYAQYSSSGLRPYPNINLPQHAGKTITQYAFNTQAHPIFTTLHSM